MSEAGRKVSAATALRAYQVIVSDGAASPDGRELDGVLAASDFDGYTISLSDRLVTVRLLFHNQLAIDSPSGKALEAFVKRIERIAGRGVSRSGR